MRPGTEGRRTTGFGVIIIASVVAGLLFGLNPQSALSAGGVDVESYRGKVVLLDFWASWCVPCRRSFPWMTDMQQKYADEGLVIVAVNLDNDVNDAESFLRQYPPGFQVAHDTDKSLARKYEVVAMPSSFLIGRDGEIVERHLGFKVLTQTEYETAIQTALRGE